MKVLLISDFGVQHTSGGAQRSNEIIVKEGISRGHKVLQFHYDSSFSTLLDKYDVVISSNLEVITRHAPQLVRDIPELDNHVRLEHDSNLYWDNEFRKRFWASCKISFFLTEFHHNFFKEIYGDIFPNVRIVPDPIDESFLDEKMERSEKIGYVGFFHELKGTQNFIDFAKENKDDEFIVCGWGDPEWSRKISSIENVDFIGKIEYSRMKDFYNSIASLYYNPICNEPFCRSIGEAIMCGTNIIGGSNRIGSLKMYKSDPNGFREKCINAASDFWEILENEFGY